MDDSLITIDKSDGKFSVSVFSGDGKIDGKVFVDLGSAVAFVCEETSRLLLEVGTDVDIKWDMEI